MILSFIHNIVKNKTSVKCKWWVLVSLINKMNTNNGEVCYQLNETQGHTKKMGY